MAGKKILCKSLKTRNLLYCIAAFNSWRPDFGTQRPSDNSVLSIHKESAWMFLQNFMTTENGHGAVAAEKGL